MKEFTDLVAGLKLSFPLTVVLFDPLDKSIESLENRIAPSRVNRVRNDVAEKLPDG